MQNVGVFFGGRSPEHDVSIATGLEILRALDATRWRAVPIYQAIDGRWWTGAALWRRETYLPGPSQYAQLEPVQLCLGGAGLQRTPRGLLAWPRPLAIDLALLAFHGVDGEDGPMQGAFELAGLPYTGPRLLPAALMMDKVATKIVLRAAGLPVLPWAVLERPASGLLVPEQDQAAALAAVGLPAIVKPVHLGSSIGVARIDDAATLAAVLPGLLRLDRAAMLEPLVPNLVEYNIAVRRTADGAVACSAIERPKSAGALLDFKAKYLAGGKGSKKLGGRDNVPGMIAMTRDLAPALPADFTDAIQDMARRTFVAVGASGAPRIDFLCNGATGELWVNEVNPIPGSFGYFLWEAAAQPRRFPGLLDDLLAEAVQFHQQRQWGGDPVPVAARLFPRDR